VLVHCIYDFFLLYLYEPDRNKLNFINGAAPAVVIVTFTQNIRKIPNKQTRFSKTVFKWSYAKNVKNFHWDPNTILEHWFIMVNSVTFPFFIIFNIA
jgi:hypothetical protein